MVKKFIDKKSAKTFQLVYRAQDDPLAFEDGSKGRVFVPAQRGAITTGAKGKETAAAGGSQAVQQGMEHMRLNGEEEEDADYALDAGGAGMAALYGIYLDDREYDYTKHLRQVGADGGSGGGVILEAPSRKEKQSGGGGIQILDPTTQQQQQATMTHHRMDVRSEAVPTGLQPHMDPRVRDVLEALDDEDAEEPEDEDDFFEKLNADELELESGDEDSDGDDYDDDDAAFDPNDVFAAIQRMKARHHQSQPHRDSGSGSDSDDDSRGGWARTASTAGTSMSSSAMFRNERLTLLDEQFDAIEAMYEKNDSDDDSDGDGGRYDADGNFIVEYDADGNPKPLSTRPDFDNVMRDFLDSYELTGKKMQTKVEGTTGAGKLSTYRHAMLDDTATDAENRRRLLAVGTRQIEETNAKSKEADDAEIDELFKGPERTPWDCQSVLSTYSNLDNHPAVIYEERRPQIRVSRKSGFPVVAASSAERQSKDSHGDDGDDGVGEKENKGAARSKGETADEKRERKRRLQEAKRERREQKKDTREVFAEKRDRRMQSKKDRAQLAVHID
ncbi:Protein ltv1 [Coemansia sp. Benny D160-2]|nr:Protein ltv1 [Coemansia sp. Benny D160-2]